MALDQQRSRGAWQHAGWLRVACGRQPPPPLHRGPTRSPTGRMSSVQKGAARMPEQWHTPPQHQPGGRPGTALRRVPTSAHAASRARRAGDTAVTRIYSSLSRQTSCSCDRCPLTDLNRAHAGLHAGLSCGGATAAASLSSR